MTSIQPKSCRRRAATLVEFAMVLPIILSLFAAMIQLSRMMLLQHTVDTAAYEGARHAMVPGATVAEARDVTEQLLRDAGLVSYEIEIQPDELTEASALITVSVTAPMDANAWIRGMPMFDIDVASDVTLMCERPPVIKISALAELKKVKAEKGKNKKEGRRDKDDDDDDD